MGNSKPIQTNSFPRYGVHFVGLVVFYVLLLATVTALIAPLVYNIAGSVYMIDITFRRTIAEQLIIYVLFCYFGNNFVLHIYNQPKKLLISVIVDFLIIPLAVALSMLYNKLTIKAHLISINEIYNVFIVTGLQVIKLLVAARILSPKKA